MTIDLAPGTMVTLDHQPYVVEEQSSLHEVNFRLDLIRLAGATAAHERWLLAVLPEPYLVILQRLEQEWLAPLRTTFVHGGEVYINLYRGAAHRVRRTRGGRSKNRMDYALFRANSGRVILTIGQNDEFEAWIGSAMPTDALELPEHALQGNIELPGGKA